MPEQRLLKVADCGEEIGQRSYQFSLHNGEQQISALAEIPKAEWVALEAAGLAFGESLNTALGLPVDPLQHLDNLVSCLETLCPQPIQEELQRTCSTLQLRSEGLFLPWELLPSVAYQTLVTRTIAAPPKILDSVPTQDTREALLGFNADGFSSWAEAEISVAEQALSGLFQMEVKQGEELTCELLQQALSSGRYSLLHLVAYATDEGLVLADGVLGLEVLQHMEGTVRPRLAVLHLISTEPNPFRVAQRVAEALLHGGVPAVLVNAWNPSVKGAATFTGSFYREHSSLLSQALVQAREESKDRLDPYLSHLAYFAFGDWDITLEQLSPMHIETLHSAPTAGGSWLADLQLVVLEGPESGLEIPLFAGVLDDGRSLTFGGPGPVEVDLVFEDESLDNLTASLEKVEGRLTFTNLTEQPEKVRVNGLPLSEPVTLEGWEEIRFGETCLRCEPASGVTSTPPIAETQQATLKVLEGVAQDRESSLELIPRVTLVGRLPDCGLVLHDPEVSRHHLTLVPKRSSFYVSSIGSATVVINGFVLRGEHQLRNGDTLQLSPSTILEFSLTRGAK